MSTDDHYDDDHHNHIDHLDHLLDYLDDHGSWITVY